MPTYTCDTETNIVSQGGRVIRNTDGTISVYTFNNATQSLQPKPMTQSCCNALAIPNSSFDPITQKCKWTTLSGGSCSSSIPLDIVLNSVGNDGSIFVTGPDETCKLIVEFDYLIKFSGGTLNKLISGQLPSDCKKVTDVFENISATMVINSLTPTQGGVQLNEVYTKNFFPLIGSGNLFNYLRQNINSGFYVTCQTTNNTEEPINLYDLSVSGSLLNCSTVVNQLTNELFIQSNLSQISTGLTAFKQFIGGNSMASDWKTFRTEISDPTIITGITNQKIKLNIRLSGTCVDFCFLVDNIRLDKACSHVSKTSVFLSKSPGFELDRVRDNKKSWLDTTKTQHRTFAVRKSDGTRPIRYTDYYTNDDRLVINSKEIDLDINIASAIENDVWCYMSDNPCILTGVSIGTTSCYKDIYSGAPGTVQSQKISITGKSAVTSVYVVTAITSNTVTTQITNYSCPAGFSATPANDQCQRIVNLPATFNGSGTPIFAGDVGGIYGSVGTYFYPTATTTALPYSYLNNGLLVDANSNVIQPVAINNNPANTFWFSNNNPSNGRLNNVGIYALNKTTPVVSTDPNWAGFTQCLNLAQAGTYYIGLAADNYCRFYVNGILVYQQLNTILESFTKWSVFPIYLNSGQNFITMEGLNGGSLSSFGAEIYYPTGATPFATLTAATSTASTQANVIFSTAEKIGENWSNGQTVGYSCQAGYSLNICNIASPVCSQVLTQPITITYIKSGSTTTGYSFTTKISGTPINLTGIVTTTSATTVYGCYPKIYCCSEYCGDKNCDIKSLLTQPLSSIQTIEDFEYYLTTELIDAKNRKIIQSYPTLRLLYDRYMNSLAYCNTQSSKFDYYTMNSFANLIGNYWVDLIEQVVPATTIWGSTKIYGNTIFDNQKFKYKNGSLLFGTNLYQNIIASSPATGQTCNTSATTEVILGNASGTTLFNNQSNIKTYSSLYVVQMNSGSEFIGSVTTNKTPTIVQCNLKITLKATNAYSNNGTITAQVFNASNPVEFLWSNGATTQSISNLSAGTYTLIVTDTVNRQCTATATATVLQETCNLTANITTTPLNITTQLGGTATVNTTGGYGGLTYLWSNSATTQTITGLSAGTYDVTVTDIKGCVATATTTLYQKFSVIAQNVSGTTFRLIQTSSPINVDWGDGTVDNFPAGYHINTGPTPVTHTYSAPYNGIININSLNLGGITDLLTDNIGPSGTTNPKIVFSGLQLSQLTGLQNLSAIIRTHLSGDSSELPRSLITLTSHNGKLYGDVANLPTGMTYLALTSSERNILSGDTSGLPRGITNLILNPGTDEFSTLGGNTISGDTAGLPTGLTYFDIWGKNTISGDVANLPRTLQTIAIKGLSQITGSIGSTPTGTTGIQLYCKDTLSGDIQAISGFSSLVYLVIENNTSYSPPFGNTISGDIKYLPKNIRTLTIRGFNTIDGNIGNMPTGSTSVAGYFNIQGYNQIYGNISGASNNFNNFIVGGNNTISGITDNIPKKYQVIIIGGDNTISGDLAATPTGLTTSSSSAPSGTTYIEIVGKTNITSYSGKTWSEKMSRISITGTTTTGFTTVNLDTLLNDLTGYTWSNTSGDILYNRFGAPKITIKGTASTASDAARQKLSGSTGSGGLGVILNLS